MMSSPATRAVRDLERELARAYDGEVPPPYYWQVPINPVRASSRRHPGELDATLPYAALPSHLLLAPAVSLDEVEDLLERRARREEI